jgi:hypothetical protein
MPRCVNLVALPFASDKNLKVEATNAFTGEKTTMFLPLTAGQFMQGMKEWDAGERIQNVFTTLNADQREFLMTGLTGKQWDKVFKDKE